MASLSSKVSGLNLEGNDEVEEVVLASHTTSAGETIGKVEIADDASKVMKGGEAADASDYANYFCSYAYLYHQKQMLTDQHRMESYHTAVLGNRELFEGKVVVDVGAGSGILSVWSGQAGASKVWAVEFTDMAKHAVALVKHNGLAESVTVVKGAVEALELPEKSVDIMISEWMGYFLLRESMLDSVLRARDRLLKPGGVMMPSSATMFWGVVECEDEREAKTEEMKESMGDWKTFVDETSANFGVDFDCLTPSYRKEQRDYSSLSSQWCELEASMVVGEPVSLLALDLHTCTVDEVLGLDKTPFSFELSEVDKVNAAASAMAQAAAEAEVQGAGALGDGEMAAAAEAVSRRVSAFAGWFEAGFHGSPANPAPTPVVLSTHPKMGYTHWGQQVFYLLEPVDLFIGDKLEGTLVMFRTKDNARLYHVGLEYSVKRADGSVTNEVKATYEIP